MTQTEDALAIPLWINGHAYLTMAPAFLDVRNPRTGEVLRRTPMCGAGEAQKAAEAAQGAMTAWATQDVSARAVLLAALGDALAGYASHFANLISEETGKQAAAAEAEVAESVALLRAAQSGDAAGVVGIAGDAVSPLSAVLRLAVPALLAGATVVLKPDPGAPSAIFALAELTGRCGFPAGVFNILHGGEAALDGLRRAEGVRFLSS